MAQGRSIKKEPARVVTEERAKLEAIQAQRDKQRELGQLLDRSLLLQQLWPEVFDHGRATGQFVGNVLYRPKDMIFKLTNGAGECREFKALDIPEGLWQAGDVADGLTYFKKNRIPKQRS